jgi:hypothetical protein
VKKTLYLRLFKALLEKLKLMLFKDPRGRSLKILTFDFEPHPLRRNNEHGIEAQRQQIVKML